MIYAIAGLMAGAALLDPAAATTSRGLRFGLLPTKSSGSTKDCTDCGLIMEPWEFQDCGKWIDNTGLIVDNENKLTDVLLSKEECDDYCLHTLDGCIGVSYEKDQERCWFVNANHGVEEDMESKETYMFCSEETIRDCGEWQHDTGLFSTKLEDVATKTEAECADLCIETPDCEGAEFDGRCWMQKNIIGYNSGMEGKSAIVICEPGSGSTSTSSSGSFSSEAECTVTAAASVWEDAVDEYVKATAAAYAGVCGSPGDSDFDEPWSEAAKAVAGAFSAVEVYCSTEGSAVACGKAKAQAESWASACGIAQATAVAEAVNDCGICEETATVTAAAIEASAATFVSLMAGAYTESDAGVCAEGDEEVYASAWQTCHAETIAIMSAKAMAETFQKYDCTSSSVEAVASVATEAKWETFEECVYETFNNGSNNGDTAASVNEWTW